MLLLPSKSREQKKLAPSFPSAKVISANVCAMVDFPVPVRLLSQNTRWPCSSSSQSSSCRRTSLLVPLRQPCMFPERCPASTVWCMLFRRIWSTSPYLPAITRHQMARKKGSRWVDSSYRTCLAVTQSEIDIKYEGSRFALIANKPDSPSWHREYLQPDHPVYPHSRRCWKIPQPSLALLIARVPVWFFRVS